MAAGAGEGREGTFRVTTRLYVLIEVEATRLFALRFDTLMKMTATTRPAQAPQPSKCLLSTYCVPGTVLGTVDKIPIPWGRWEPADTMTTGLCQAGCSAESHAAGDRRDQVHPKVVRRLFPPRGVPLRRVPSSPKWGQALGEGPDASCPSRRR